MNDYRAYVECDYNSIYHHGVEGMKWGRRRYQNEDGSYKPGAEGRYYDKVKGFAKKLMHPSDYGHNGGINVKKKMDTIDRIRETGTKDKESNNKMHDYLMSQTKNANDSFDDRMKQLKKKNRKEYKKIKSMKSNYDNAYKALEKRRKNGENVELAATPDLRYLYIRYKNKNERDFDVEGGVSIKDFEDLLKKRGLSV